jgi:hypothetical protein
MFDDDDNGKELVDEKEVARRLPLSARLFPSARGIAAQAAIAERMIVFESFMVDGNQNLF